MIQPGQRFGKLTIVGPADGQDMGPLPAVSGGWWTARCVCDRELVAPAEAFLAGRVTSCGLPTPEQRAAQADQLAAYQSPPRW